MGANTTFDAIRRFWWLILVFIIGGGVIAGLPEPPTATEAVTRWTASHTILVSGSSGDRGSYDDRISFNQLQLFATTGQVPSRVAAKLDYNGPSAALAAQISVTAEQQTGALRITTTQATAEQAVEVADAFAGELISYLAERQDELQQDRLNSTLTRLTGLEQEVNDAERAVRADEDDELARAQLDALTRRYGVVFEQYNVLQTEPAGSLVLTTLQTAQPIASTQSGLSSLSAPRSRVARGTLGGIVGGALGLGLAVLLARNDRKIRSRQQAEQVLGMAAHASIPEVPNHHAGDLAVVPDRHDPLSDSYRALRSLISFIGSGSQHLGERATITLVVSAGPGDGKTSITANLASAFVEAGSRTVAINTDFRRPTLSRRLAVAHPEPVGLSLGQVEHAPLELVLAPVAGVEMSVLDLSSMNRENPGELARLSARLLPRIAAVNDQIVIDSSPVGGTAEVLEFVPLADNIVMVITLGHTQIEAAKRSIEMIRALSTGHLLLVIIGGDTDETSYYYYSTTTPKASKRRFGRTSRKRDRDQTNAATMPGERPFRPIVQHDAEPVGTYTDELLFDLSLGMAAQPASTDTDIVSLDDELAWGTDQPDSPNWSPPGTGGSRDR